MSSDTSWPPPSRVGEPFWEIAQFFPDQGSWSEDAYLALTTNHLVEFDNGMLELVPMPTKFHQIIAAFLFKLIDNLFCGNGRVLFAPYRLRIPGRKYREPGIIYMTPQQDAVAGNRFTDAVELVMEIVSEDDPERDYVKKRADYAIAHVPEYWIVDPKLRRVYVLQLQDGQYVEHGPYCPGTWAFSLRLPGLSIAVDEVFASVP